MRQCINSLDDSIMYSNVNGSTMQFVSAVRFWAIYGKCTAFCIAITDHLTCNSHALLTKSDLLVDSGASKVLQVTYWGEKVLASDEDLTNFGARRGTRHKIDQKLES